MSTGPLTKNANVVEMSDRKKEIKRLLKKQKSVKSGNEKQKRLKKKKRKRIKLSRKSVMPKEKSVINNV